jgi:Holliday junction resolvasome RuvABC endonuclease subunit
MNLVGIDLGIHKIALAVFVEGTLVHAEAYEVDDDDRGVQLAKLGSRTSGLAFLHDADSIWIEDVIIGNNRKYSLRLAETKGAVLASLALNFIQKGAVTRLVDNQVWKKHVVGSGNATKDMVKDYIEVVHPAYAPLCGDDQDLYDAACVGLYGLQILDRAAHLQL